MRKDRDRIGPLAFTRLYAVVSLISILITATALAILYRELSIRTVIEFGEQYNTAVATTALNAFLPELAHYLQADPPMTGSVATSSIPAELLSLIQASIRDSAIERVKVYNEKGIVLYSTLEHATGRDDSSNQQFQQAIRGEIRSELSYRDAFNLFDYGAGDDNLIETYVPIRNSGNPHPVGVFEIYTDVNPIVRAMTRHELLIFTGIALLMVILYGFLLLVVRRADKIITNQRQTIIQRNQMLELLSARMLANDETERRQIAWELHEGIAQTLSAAKIKLEAFANAAVQSDTQMGSIPNNELVPLLEDAIQDVRALAMDLRPPALDDFGLTAATRGLCKEAEQTHGQLGIITDIAMSDEDIPDPLKSIIFRILQQTLHHLVRIPGINDIRIGLRRENGLLLIVDFGAETSETVNPHVRPSVSDQQQIAKLWERSVLSGGSFTTAHTDNGRFSFQATWIV